jgi:Fic family protein
LAELKGFCENLPNPKILLNTVMLQESKDSSAIENIVTTQDDLYRAVLNPSDTIPPNTKEVLRYREAIHAEDSWLHPFKDMGYTQVSLEFPMIIVLLS